MALKDTKNKISSQELATLQMLMHRLEVAQAAVQGALGALAASYLLPDGTQIDPETGAITLPKQEANAE